MNACTLKHTRTQVYIHACKHANKHIYATRVDMRAGSCADIFARVSTCRYVRAVLQIHVHLHMGDPKNPEPNNVDVSFFTSAGGAAAAHNLAATGVLAGLS